jgi:putative ATPase
VGKGKIVRSFLESKKINSIIFWGPPGTGKTTLSRIIIREMNCPAIEFSATISGINEVREVMKKATETKKITGDPLVVFVDEIHHFNKHTQDAFLPFVEKGDIILLGTTIENPAYKLNRALLSRLKVLEFYPLDEHSLKNILKKGQKILEEETQSRFNLSDGVKNILLNYSLGDARRLLNLMELILIFSHEEKQSLTEKLVLEIIQSKFGAYDRSGDDRYQFISAYHKSVRNSDMDASLFWLYRMLEGGEDPLFILRRMIRISAEDIGLADPEALQICLNAKDAYEFLGQPEGNLFLAQATIYLVSAPKSNSIYKTEKKMKKIVEKYRIAPIPLHIINPSNFIVAQKGAGMDYQYAHDYAEKTTLMKTLPESIKERGFYQPNLLGFEKKIKDRISYWEKIKAKLSKKEK